MRLKVLYTYNSEYPLMMNILKVKQFFSSFPHFRVLVTVIVTFFICLLRRTSISLFFKLLIWSLMLILLINVKGGEFCVSKILIYIFSFCWHTTYTLWSFTVSCLPHFFTILFLCPSRWGNHSTVIRYIKRHYVYN